jgi:hypothetical protein
VALLLPAVQAAREAARRSQCQNNLKQMGLACLNYESTKKSLPPGHVAFADDDQPRDPTGTGWTIEILPFIEAQNVYEQFDFENRKSYRSTAVNPSGVSNVVAAQNRIDAYQCPSDDQTNILLRPPGENADATPSSYRGVAGIIDRRVQGVNIWWDRVNPGQNALRKTWRGFRGPLSAAGDPIGAKPVRLAQITDGTTNTAMIGEFLTITIPERKAFWGKPWRYFNKGHFSVDANGFGSIYREPDFERCSTPVSSGGSGGDIFLCARSFGTLHAGKVIQFAMCDGSVQGIAEGIDDDVYLSLGSIANGEVLQDAL